MRLYGTQCQTAARCYVGIMISTASSENLWGKTRALVYAQVVDVSLELFISQGFEATTIDQIVAVAGISRRSFFRYFGTKEDIVLGDLSAQGENLAEALAARPKEEDPWTALERAAAAVPALNISDQRAFAIAKLVNTTPAIRARHAQKHAEWQRLLVPVVQARLGGIPTTPSIRATAIVATVLACLDAAMDVWVENGGRQDFNDLYAQAISTVRNVPPAPDTPERR